MRGRRGFPLSLPLKSIGAEHSCLFESMSVDARCVTNWRLKEYSAIGANPIRFELLRCRFTTHIRMPIDSCRVFVRRFGNMFIPRSFRALLVTSVIHFLD